MGRRLFGQRRRDGRRERAGLPRAEIDVQQNLFDLGARSLTVVRALTELRRRGFHTLSAAQIYEHPSVARLASPLSDAPAAAPSSADELARGNRQRAALARFAPRRGGMQ